MILASPSCAPPPPYLQAACAEHKRALIQAEDAFDAFPDQRNALTLVVVARREAYFQCLEPKRPVARAAPNTEPPMK